MDSLHSLLWQAMAIESHIAQSIVAGNAHRWTRWRSIFFDNVYRSTVSPIHCRQQYLSMDIFRNLMSPTISIDRVPPSSIVQAIDHCCVFCPECGNYRPATSCNYSSFGFAHWYMLRDFSIYFVKPTGFLLQWLSVASAKVLNSGLIFLNIFVSTAKLSSCRNEALFMSLAWLQHHTERCLVEWLRTIDHHTSI